MALIKYLDYIIYWTIVCIPFFVAIAPAPANVFMGFLIAAFILKKILKKERVFINTPINIPLLCLFIVTSLSLINSINYPDSIKGGIFRLLQYIFVFFSIAENVKETKHIKIIVFSILAGLTIASVDAIWQASTGWDFIRGYAPTINLGLVRATASFKDANLLGIYLSAFAPLLFGLNLYYYQKTKRAALILISFITLIGIVLTFSRPTLLAVYIALFFLGFVQKDKLLISLLIILMLISPFILPKSVKNWAKEVEYNPVRFMCNDDRIAVYHNSLNMIRAHPVIGVGANTYMKNYKQYKQFPEYRNVVTLDYMHAHNMYLHMICEIGLIGIAMFTWLLYNLFARAKIIYKAQSQQYLKVLSISLAACLTAFLVNGLTESSLYYSRVAVIFWYLCGLLLSLNKFVQENRLRQ
ncbi:MAG: O-antigen ligase family protein [Candidatus Omnitrophota bacterium]